MKQTKPVTLIATIAPPDAKGKRKITVAAAPEGQMPARTFTGAFADLHSFVDQAWIAALTERPATVAKSAPAPKAGSKKRTNMSGSESEAEATEVESLEPLTTDSGSSEPEDTADEVEAPEPLTEASDESEEQLPLIEGDTQ